MTTHRTNLSEDEYFARQEAERRRVQSLKQQQPEQAENKRLEAIAPLLRRPPQSTPIAAIDQPHEVSEVMTAEGASAATAIFRATRKVAVTMLGFSVLAVGVALIVLPGPAIVVIPVGLAILATEFLWARRLLRRLRDRANRVLRRPITEKGEP